MSNRTNIILGLLILGFVAVDLWVLHSGATMFLVRKLFDLVEYLSFWR